MENKIPKTGLAESMRSWMKARTGTKTQRRFSISQICKGLQITPGPMHQKIANALYDFEQRGEVMGYHSKKHNRRQYVYVGTDRRSLWGKQNQKIFKAMYVSQSFAVTDIQRLTGITERAGIEKTVRLLKKEGYLLQIARRHRANSPGVENIYYVTNRDQFKLTVMKGN